MDDERVSELPIQPCAARSPYRWALWTNRSNSAATRWSPNWPAPAGHVAVVGGPHSGKSMMVRSLITALALTHTPAETQFYCLDFGGGALSSLAELPHVGSIATRLAPDRVRRTIAELDTLLAQREERFAALGVDSMAEYRRLLRAGKAPADERYGDVFLVVDGWLTLRQEFEGAGHVDRQPGRARVEFGIHVVLTASRWGEIRSQIGICSARGFELRPRRRVRV